MPECNCHNTSISSQLICGRIPGPVLPKSSRLRAEPVKKYKVTPAADERRSLKKLIAAGKAAAQELAHARILLKAANRVAARHGHRLADGQPFRPDLVQQVEGELPLTFALGGALAAPRPASDGQHRPPTTRGETPARRVGSAPSERRNGPGRRPDNWHSSRSLAPQYCLCAPTECRPCFGKVVSSFTNTAFDSANVAAKWARSRRRTVSWSHRFWLTNCWSACTGSLLVSPSGRGTRRDSGSILLRSPSVSRPCK